MRVFLTGVTGTMGRKSLDFLRPEHDLALTALVQDTEKDRRIIQKYADMENLEVVYGDLTRYEDVRRCVKGADLIVHMGALVSPRADYFPAEARKVNVGSIRNILRALRELHQEETTRLVWIGSVAQTGDRMPPIHWGRVGDPIKPSIYDYYAVSKVEAERLVVESGLRRWASLRQSGIMGPAMGKIRDAIIFHNPFDNVLEYCSDDGAGRLVRNLCRLAADDALEESFWNHIYNIGGGKDCRISGYDLYRRAYEMLGIRNLDRVLDPKRAALRNFHGQYYLDSDKLERHLHFRHDSIAYFFESFLQDSRIPPGFVKGLCSLPWMDRAVSSLIAGKFDKLALSEHGTMRFIRENMEPQIEAYWGSRKNWERIPGKVSDFPHFQHWDQVVWIDHGYDEAKKESELDIEEVRHAAHFRGGELLSASMEKGDWRTKLTFRCAFGHVFEASPRLVLEGGHWCPECERKSWNYGKRAKVDPFFAQVWDPLHEDTEMREYPKAAGIEGEREHEPLL